MYTERLRGCVQGVLTMAQTMSIEVGRRARAESDVFQLATRQRRGTKVRRASVSKLPHSTSCFISCEPFMHDACAL